MEKREKRKNKKEKKRKGKKGAKNAQKEHNHNHKHSKKNKGAFNAAPKQKKYSFKKLAQMFKTSLKPDADDLLGCKFCFKRIRQEDLLIDDIVDTSYNRRKLVLSKTEKDKLKKKRKEKKAGVRKPREPYDEDCCMEG